MEDVVDKFRDFLSVELKSAIAKRDKEDVSTIREIMSALDNSSAWTQEEIASLKDSTKTEVPRRKLNKQDIQTIIRSEIAIRENALRDYERLGNNTQADLIKKSISTINRLSAMLF
ncbi:hypothetical protein [Bdellovibrio sp. HCB209]|uniref:hypothetical protein n=1 Tax=Bdellovibrio sp. HCB209 TaxID=3394354 RepID=UPI0039B5FDC7